MKNTYLDNLELKELGIKRIGNNAKISRNAILRNPENLILGDQVRIDDYSILSGNIEIGSFVHIAPFCLLYGQDEIIIEDFCGLSSRVTFYTASDDFIFGNSLTNPTIPPKYRTVIDTGRIVIKKHSIIGCNTVIFPNTILEQGCSIGACSFIKGNLKEWTVYKGNPAKIVAKRKSKRILQMERKLLDEYYPPDD